MEVLKIGGVDYSTHIEEKGISWSRNDVDSEKTKRVKNGTLRRDKITTKRKLSYKLFHMTREELAGKVVIGELLRRTDRRPFDEIYYDMVRKAQAAKGEKL